MNRAYSTFEIKSVDDDQRIIEGIATTPTTDRAGDIVEPKGAQFKLPLPLLYQHNSDQPIGHVTSAKVTAEGISIKAKMAAPGVAPFIDEAWALMKAGLVRGLSIGFRPIESAQIKDTYAMRFLKWDWLELSAVTIAANADASILSIKAIDDEILRAASGDTAKKSDVVRLIKSPGASGQSVITPKGKTMKTYKEMIAALEATRMAKAAELAEIAKATTEKGETMDAETGDQFDALTADVANIDKDLKRYRALYEINITEAVPVKNEPFQLPAQKAAAAGTGIRVVSNLAPGQKMGRWALAMKRANGNMTDMLSVIQNNKEWMDTSPELALVAKTAVNAGDTTTSGWASELVYATNLANEFIDYLRPKTIIGRIPGFIRVPFNMRVGSLTGVPTGYWVGQGKAILPSKLTTGSASLGMTKAAGMCVVDDELVKSSSPSVELLIRDQLTKSIVQMEDLSLIDPNQGGTANVQPASLTYGVTPITPSGVTAAALLADLRSLFATMMAANVDISQSVLVSVETTAMALQFMMTSLGAFQFPSVQRTGGSLMSWPVIVSNTANIAGSPQFGHMIVAINPGEVFMADEGQVVVSLSNEASIEMVDSSSQQSTATSAGASLVSMFQTQSEAIKGVHYINWLKRRASAAAFIQAAAYA